MESLSTIAEANKRIAQHEAATVIVVSREIRWPPRQSPHG
jgi:hypothetical protein